MGRKRKKRREAREHHERWLITYADLITLLMIFFVTLYAMSRLDAQKYDTLARSLHLQFRHADSILELGDGVLDGARSGENPSDPASAPFRAPTASPSPKSAGDAATEKRGEQDLRDLLRVIRAYVRENHLENEVFVGDTPRGIVIRLSDRLLFDLGSAELRKAALPVLDKLSDLFAQLDQATVSIQGHTDDLPVLPGARFRDNWELSAARALSVLRYFVETKGLEARRFEVAGYADTRPVAPNTSESNRQRNRRVEIVVERQLGEAERF
jgi:chemotaxis protein MotB